MIAAEAGDLYCREAGSGRSVLLIHGSGFDASTWGGVYDELTREHRVIVYNRRGYRGSASLTRRWSDHVEDAQRLLRSLDAWPATVVGHSAGAIVATDLAIRMPQLVRSLVLLDPALYIRKHLTLDFARAFLAAQTIRRLRGEQRGVERFYRWATSYPDGDTAWDREDFPSDWREAMLANASAVFADMRAGDGSHIASAALAAIEAKVTIVEGELSPKLYKRVARWLMGRIPRVTKTVLVGSAHTMMLDRPLELAEVVRDVARLEGEGQ